MLGKAEFIVEGTKLAKSAKIFAGEIGSLEIRNCMADKMKSRRNESPDGSGESTADSQTFAPSASHGEGRAGTTASDGTAGERDGTAGEREGANVDGERAGGRDMGEGWENDRGEDANEDGATAG